MSKNKSFGTYSNGIPKRLCANCPYKKVATSSFANLSNTSILVGCILIAIFMVSMTIARSSNESDLALSQIYRYLGEGFVNFAETGWYINNHTLI